MPLCPPGQQENKARAQRWCPWQECAHVAWRRGRLAVLGTRPGCIHPSVGRGRRHHQVGGDGLGAGGWARQYRTPPPPLSPLSQGMVCVPFQGRCLSRSPARSRTTGPSGDGVVAPRSRVQSNSPSWWDESLQMPVDNACLRCDGAWGSQ